MGYDGICWVLLTEAPSPAMSIVGTVGGQVLESLVIQQLAIKHRQFINDLTLKHGDFPVRKLFKQTSGFFQSYTRLFLFPNSVS
jgi:hypothetical protein